MKPLELEPSRTESTRRRDAQEEATTERLEHAIKLVAYIMVRHNRPRAIKLLKRLEAERDLLVQKGGALDYARRVLAQSKGGDDN